VKTFLLDSAGKPENPELLERIRQVMLVCGGDGGQFLPTKFFQWVGSKGLLRSTLQCRVHNIIDRQLRKFTKLRLGSSGDAEYVWIPKCCKDESPLRLPVSIFEGTVFEFQPSVPNILTKLIYYWARQDKAEDVVECLRIDPDEMNNFYTLLRSCCVAAVHEFSGLMGGDGNTVELGVITFNSPAGAHIVSVQVMGIFDRTSKMVRMKVLNPYSRVVSPSFYLATVLTNLWITE
jgi:hypothetical protein